MLVCNGYKLTLLQTPVHLDKYKNITQIWYIQWNYRRVHLLGVRWESLASTNFPGTRVHKWYSVRMV